MNDEIRSQLAKIAWQTNADKHRVEGIINHLLQQIEELQKKPEGKPKSNVNDSLGTKQS